MHGASFKDLGFGTIKRGVLNARLAISKVCWNLGPSASANVLRVTDEAIHDRVHVLSLLIGVPLPLAFGVNNAIVIDANHAMIKEILSFVKLEMVDLLLKQL